jgi:hypothetical protein
LRELPVPPNVLATDSKNLPTGLYISGHITHNDAQHKVLVLLDSGCTTSTISRQTVARYKLKTRSLPSPILATNADGTPNIGGYITEAIMLPLTIGDVTHKWSFRVTHLHDADIYLGFDWLHHYNPAINWQQLSLSVPEVAAIKRT